MTTINPETVELLRMLDEQRPGTVAELVRLFSVDAPVLLQRIYGAHALQDADGLRQAAHYLRSSSLALGLTDIEQTALSIERDDFKDIGNAALPAKLDTLKVQVEAAVKELNTLFSS
jgi:HPt (histidine-containing phosphotransfer) domain-containing protein